jgi:2-oxoglutarate dehydrogenase E2 component (dihydrolipoamide succinyltransferase)
MSNKIEIVLPKMGESVDEATITGWLKNEGDFIKEDDLIVEIATDKVDSEVPSEFSGVLIKKLCEVNDVVKVGDPIAIIETENEIKKNNTISEIKDSSNENIAVDSPKDYIEKAEKIIDTNDSELTEKIYSPLVKNISKKEGISFAELDSIIGSGKNGRVTKKDILNYISKNKSQESFNNNKPYQANVNKPFDEITEMTRMEKLISDHMLSSKQKSAHVQAFIEADITNLYKWREKK